MHGKGVNKRGLRGAGLGVNNFRFHMATVILSFGFSSSVELVIAWIGGRSREAALGSSKRPPFRAVLVHKLHRLLCWCLKKTMVQSPSCLTSKLTFVPIHSSDRRPIARAWRAEAQA